MDTNDNILSVDIDKDERDPESSSLMIQGVPPVLQDYIYDAIENIRKEFNRLKSINKYAAIGSQFTLFTEGFVYDDATCKICVGTCDTSDASFDDTITFLNELVAHTDICLKDRGMYLCFPADNLPKNKINLYLSLESFKTSIMGWNYTKNLPVTEASSSTALPTNKNALKNLMEIAKGIVEKSNEIKDAQMKEFSEIISNDLLQKWAPGFQKVKFELTNDKENMVSYLIPTLDQTFISRFVEGTEQIKGFLHKDPSIKIRISKSIFEDAKSPEDIVKFLKRTVQYYDKGASTITNKLMYRATRIPPNMKKFIRENQSFYKIFATPMESVFNIKNVKLNDPSTLMISSDVIKSINTFFQSIAKRYINPLKDKDKILNDVKSLIGLNKKDEKSFNESIENFVNGSYNESMELLHLEYARTQWDLEVLNDRDRYWRESSGMKKLKKIPRSIIPYIQIEIESIKDDIDKNLIVGYIVSKLDLVDWYIELLDTGSNKYIVPHTRLYLVSFKKELLKLYKMAMNKVPSDRTKNRIPYPEGYEG